MSGFSALAGPLPIAANAIASPAIVIDVMRTVPANPLANGNARTNSDVTDISALLSKIMRFPARARWLSPGKVTALF
jgi:hypothetical protein